MKYKTPAACYAYLVIICKIYKKKQSNNKNETYEGEGEDDDDDDDDDDVVDDQEPVVWSNAEEEIFDEVYILKNKNFNGILCFFIYIPGSSTEI